MSPKELAFITALLASITLIVNGVWMLSEAAGLIVAGILVSAFAVLVFAEVD